MFFGASAADVSIPYQADATSEVAFMTDGRFGSYRYNVPGFGSGTTYYPATWLTTSGHPTSVSDDYEIRATLTSGNTPTTNAGLNTWLNLGTERVWGNSAFRTTLGITNYGSAILFEIRPAGGGAVLASANMTIACSAECSM
jgi:hypothetical protein